MKGCKHRINGKCNLFSNEWAESRCHIKNETECPYHEAVFYTQADRVRAMSDEELARLYAEKVSLCYGCNASTMEDCYKCWLDWLQKEAE